MKVIVSGSVNGVNYQTIDKFIRDSGFDVNTIVTCKRKGVDAEAEKWAVLNDRRLECGVALWDKHGACAEYILNRELVKNADALIAVWDGVSKVTRDLIDVAKRNHLKVVVKKVPVKHDVSLKDW